MADAFLKQFEEAWRPLDRQVAAVLGVLYAKAQGKPPLFSLSPEEVRRAVAPLDFFVSAGAPAVPHIGTLTIPGATGPVRVRLYDPGVPAPAPTIIYLHGGGWVLNTIDSYDGPVRQLAKRSGMRVLSVDYGLAPEHPFPFPLQDCIAAIRWAVSEGHKIGIDANRLVLAGDSAGANLALASMISLRDEGRLPVRGAALIYGAYSSDTDTPSQRAYGSGAYLMGTADVKWYLNHYLSKPEDRKNPLASPLLADLNNLPPLYVTACEFDVLRSDSEMLADKLKAASVPFEFHLWKGMVHACFSLMGWIDAMGPEIDRVGAFLRRTSGAGG